MDAQYLKIICSVLKLDPEQIMEYPSSYVHIADDQLLMCKIHGTKKILAIGHGDVFSHLEGEILSEEIKLCPLSHENRLILNKYLPYTLPSAFGRHTATLGLGDRLGIASPGHIQCVRNSSIKPILAQQSKRELDLTGRSYEQVLDDVCFAVFQEGYRGGFGADGDHLKNIDDIQYALGCGYTMITLDCSENIGSGIDTLADSELLNVYEKLSFDYRKRIEDTYLSKGFLIGGEEYVFSKVELIRCALIYHRAVDFVLKVYSQCIRKEEHVIDFELSIDETESVTTAQGHLFVAMELEYYGVEVTSLAPRFIGEFQKGIDYMGDISQFEQQLNQHAAIADHFGYKLSIHSGSDKFSVFPLIGQYTAGRLHLKTSGTNWLEALRTIAVKNPTLYRRIHQKALEYFNQAKTFYHVSADPDKIDDLHSIKDENLMDYLDDDNSRQLLHITYGFVLDDPVLRKDVYHTLAVNEEHYYERLNYHIGRHIDLISLGLTE